MLFSVANYSPAYYITRAGFPGLLLFKVSNTLPGFIEPIKKKKSD